MQVGVDLEMAADSGPVVELSCHVAAAGFEARWDGHAESVNVLQDIQGERGARNAGRFPTLCSKVG